MATFSPDTFVTDETIIEKYSSIEFTTTSVVTLVELQSLAASVAQQMVASMAIIGWTRVPADFPGSLTEPERTLLEEANALGTAWQAVMATYFANRSPNRTTHTGNLAQMYNRALTLLLRFLKETKIDLRSTDHLVEGDVTRITVTTTPDQDDLFEFGDEL